MTIGRRQGKATQNLGKFLGSAPLTSTVIFSIGPTTQMTGTFIMTRPYQLFVPLLTREQSGSW